MTQAERDLADDFCRDWNGRTFLESWESDRTTAVSAWLFVTAETEVEYRHFVRHELMRQDSVVHHGIERLEVLANGGAR